jgi:DNA-binding beta-propeller fold protein YncE
MTTPRHGLHSPAAATAEVGRGRFRYVPDPGWPVLPDGWALGEVVAAAVDSRDHLYLFDRGEHPVLVFDADGNFLRAWGEGRFARPHGLAIGPDDSLYCVDDLDHTVRKFTPAGELLLTLGTSGKSSDTGATTVDYRTITRAGPPFNFPTNPALGPAGELYVADGYGNARVHKFAPDGRLLLSWGEPGDGPGQFHVPHGIAVDRHGTVYVCDRENSRIQLFNPGGRYLSQWTGLARPCQVYIGPDGVFYVAELGYRAGMWPGTTAPAPDATGGRVSILDRGGDVLARFGGGGADPCAPGDFFAPHGICVDSHGTLYVAEVVTSAGGRRGMVPPGCHTVQRFLRSRAPGPAGVRNLRQSLPNVRG